MPIPRKPIVISVKVTNGSSGEIVSVSNLTSGGKITGIINSKGETMINQPSGYTWVEGDTIIAEIHGRINQSSSSTISSGGADFILGNSASTSTASVVLG